MILSHYGHSWRLDYQDEAARFGSGAGRLRFLRHRYATPLQETNQRRTRRAESHPKPLIFNDLHRRPSAHRTVWLQVRKSLPGPPATLSREPTLPEFGDFGRPIMGGFWSGWMGFRSERGSIWAWRVQKTPPPVSPRDSVRPWAGMRRHAKETRFSKRLRRGSRRLSLRAGAPAARGRSAGDRSQLGRNSGLSCARAQSVIRASYDPSGSGGWKAIGSGGMCQTLNASLLIRKARRKIRGPRGRHSRRAKGSRARRVDGGLGQEGQRQRHADGARGAVLVAASSAISLTLIL